MTEPQSLRERRRSATLAMIKQSALEQIRGEGAPALSIRGVAREIGLSPAGMYRYYDSRDALLTDLLTDAYRDLADAVSAAAGPLANETAGDRPAAVAGPAPTDRLRAAVMAYRDWAVSNPNRFMLIFGTPVPGYAAPPEGPTVVENRRMGGVLYQLTAMAWAAGELAEPPLLRSPTALEDALLAQIRQGCPDFPAGMIPVMIGGWALWHGLVTLEVTNQLRWIYPDAEAFFAERIDAWLAAVRRSAPGT